MTDFPEDALPGEIAQGPDGKYYKLQWNEEWWPVTKAAFLDQQRTRREEEKQEAARAAQPALPVPITAVPSSLPPSPFVIRGPEDEQNAIFYAGEYDAVEAEAAGWTRPDGWTAERRILFLERLAEHGSVRRAAACAGVTRQAVWKLRQRAPAFRAAYDAAVRQSVEIMADTAIDRAIHGSEEPVFHQGEQVGTRTRHHDRLLTYLLRVRDPLNYAPIDELERWQKHRPLSADAVSPARREAGALPSPPPTDDGGL